MKKRTFKPVFAVTLAATMMLTACGGGAAATTAAATTAAATEAATTAAETTTAEATTVAEEAKIKKDEIVVA